MNTTLSADGKIGLPEQILHADQLAAGAAFDLTRLAAGQYLLTLKKQPAANRVEIVEGPDGHLVFKTFDGRVITSAMVKEIESLAP